MSGPANTYSVYCPPSKTIRYSSGSENSYAPRYPLSRKDPAMAPAG